MTTCVLSNASRVMVLFLGGCCLFLHPGAKAAVPRKPRPNVILITLDTVRADRVGCYGATDVQTPTIDDLARDGVVFERAVSQVPITWPSHAVILTGMYPFQTGVRDFTGQPLEARFRTVAQAFKKQGYATGAVVSSFVLDRSWGLARGFDFYDDAFAPEAFLTKNLGLVDRRADESVTRALGWLRKRSDRPFFFWLHLFDPHSPYDPPEPFRTEYKGRPYDGEIAYADREVGRLIAWLKQNRLYDRSLIVVLSDHGEALGDHQEKEHGFFVYNSTVHIPLIVKPPAGSGIRPGRVSRPVETTAVAPTLLRAAGLKDSIEKQFSSKGLFGNRAEEEDSAYSETFYPFSSFGWSPLHALETSRYHFIDAPEPELYDLSSDPQEKNNLAPQRAQTVAVLKDKLRQRQAENPFMPAAGESPKIRPDVAQKLRALGYLAYRSPVSQQALAAGLPDPKSKLWEFNTILEATDAFQAGDHATGMALVGKVREKDSSIYLLSFLVGESALTRQKWDEAEAEFKKCLELNPNFDQAMTGLSRALLNQGKLEEATSWAKNALKVNSQNYRAWFALGYAEAKGNDIRAAIEAYEKAASIQGNVAPIRRDLGLLYFRQENYGEAAKHLAAAIDLGLKDATIFNTLGISYSRINRLTRAVAAYREALKLDPNRAEAHLNLGFAYQRLNRSGDAAREYAAACQLNSKFCQVTPKQR